MIKYLLMINTAFMVGIFCHKTMHILHVYGLQGFCRISLFVYLWFYVSLEIFSLIWIRLSDQSVVWGNLHTNAFIKIVWGSTLRFISSSTINAHNWISVYGWTLTTLRNIPDIYTQSPCRLTCMPLEIAGSLYISAKIRIITLRSKDILLQFIY